MKKFIYNNYWIFAGIIIGVLSVIFMYFSFNLIVRDVIIQDNGVVSNNYSWLGAIEVTVEYAVAIFIFSLIQKIFKDKN